MSQTVLCAFRFSLKMNPLNHDITCRRAAIKDYDGIMAIDTNVYDGLDYLPILFNKYMESKRRILVVAEKSGTIVGIINSKLYNELCHKFAVVSEIINSIDQRMWCLYMRPPQSNTFK